MSALTRLSPTLRTITTPLRRTLTTTTTSLPPPPPPSGYAPLPSRRLLALSGPDAPKFLQGILTANVPPPTPASSPGGNNAGFYATFLTAPGKVLNDVFVYATRGTELHGRIHGGGAGAGGGEEPGYVVEVDGGQVELLMKHLKRHKLRSQLALRAVEEGEVGVWSLWREDERWTAFGGGGGGSEGGLVGLTDCRAPGMGRRVLVPGDGVGKGAVERAFEGLEQAGEGAYTVRRYLRGVAEGQAEILRDESLPMNTNVDLMGGIDFKKGCYIGQELTIRTHHTGVVRRRILPVRTYALGSEPPEKLEYEAKGEVQGAAGQDIAREGRRKRATGRFIAGVGDVGLAMCRLEQMSDLTVSGEGSAFSAEDRFLVMGSEGVDVGVKAFVPDWVRGKVREPKIQRRVE